MLSILVELLQIHKWVRLESLANRLPIPILFENRRKKLQRFLDLEIFNISKIWFPLVTEIIKILYKPSSTLYLVLDRTRYKTINLLMVSLIYKNRAIPVYFELLSKKGNSSGAKQIEVLDKTLPLLEKYEIIILGDREFCGVELAQWLKEKAQVKFVLRVKKNEYFQRDGEWKTLKDLGLTPGMSLYLEGVKVTKSKGFGDVNIAAKWKKNYRSNRSQEPWFLLTNLPSLSLAIDAYKKRMGIEEMFRDFKKGGYNLEATQLNGKRLLSLIILISIAYTDAILTGNNLQQKGIAKYIGRAKEAKRQIRRHSRFYLGLHGQDWLDSLMIFGETVVELLSESPQKYTYYQQGRRAVTLIQSVF